MVLVRLLSILSVREVVAGWSVADVDSGSMTGCIVEVEGAMGIVADDMKVMVVRMLMLIVADCSSIILVIDGTIVLTSVISVDVLIATETNIFEFPRLLSTLEVVGMEGTKAVLISVISADVLITMATADVLITMETNVFEFLSTLEVVAMEGTKAVGTVDDGMSSSLIDIPLPSSSIIIPAVSGQIVVQDCSRSRQ